MTEHDKILKMLETVDPSDTKTLDEIDARIWCLTHKDMVYKKHNAEFVWYGWTDTDNGAEDEYLKYTRSLDVLRDAQGEGWVCDTSCDVICNRFCCVAYCYEGAGLSEVLHEHESVWLKTEALARCHAFVQTIKWRDGNV